MSERLVPEPQNSQPAPRAGDRPLKVMHIIARLNIGGAAPYVILLADALGPPGFESQVVCGVVGKTEGDMRYLADEKHIRLTVLPGMGREISPLRDLGTVLSLWRLIRSERPDVVHTHTAKAGFVGRIAAWLARVPVILHTFHGHVFAGYFGPRKTQVYLTLERLCARLSTRIITLSDGLKRELAETYRIAAPERIEVLELGFTLADLADPSDAADLRRSFREKYHIPQDRPVVGIVGRLVPIKNHDLFLQAAVIIHATLPDVHFAIVGDGERRADLEAQVAQVGLTEHVHFTGWITDVRPVYKGIDAVALTSLNEGLPVSLIEAMAAGVPVAATRVGGVADLLDDGRLGAIVSLNDPVALAAALFSALTDSALAARTALARDTALARYDIRSSAAKTGALYRRLLAERRS